MKSFSQLMGCAALGAMLVSAPVGAWQNDSAPKVSAPGVYAGYSPKRYDSYTRTSFHVPVRDGTKLAVDLFRPLVNGKPVTTKLPVVWIHTPYLRAVRNLDGSWKKGGGNRIYECA